MQLVRADLSGVGAQRVYRSYISDLTAWSLTGSRLKMLRRRFGYAAGAYVVVESFGISPREIRRRALRGELKIVYIGASDALAGWHHRIRSLCSGWAREALVSDHDLIRKLRGPLREVVDTRSLSIILLPFESGWSLEFFLLAQHRIAFGARPVGNVRRGGPTSARNGRVYVEAAWSDLLPQTRKPGLR